MSNVLQFNRYKPLAVVVGLLLAVLTALDVILRMSAGMSPSALARVEFLDPAKQDALGGRVSAITAERRATRSPPPLGVVVGFSSAREGIESRLLEQEDSQHRRWLNLAGSGGSYYELEYYLDALFSSELDPEVIVFALHPSWLAGRDSTTLEGDPLLSKQGSRLKTGLRQASWFLFNRVRAGLGMRRAWATARSAWAEKMGLSHEVLFPPTPDPWTEQRRYRGVRDAKETELQLASWKAMGWFDPAHYRTDSEEVVCLERILRKLQAFSPRLLIVMAPESSVLRTRVPAEAEAVLRASVQKALGTSEVLDLRDAVPDEAFHDFAHVNEKGRPIFTRAVANKVAEVRFSCDAPGSEASATRLCALRARRLEGSVSLSGEKSAVLTPFGPEAAESRADTRPSWK